MNRRKFVIGGIAAATVARGLAVEPSKVGQGADGATTIRIGTCCLDLPNAKVAGLDGVEPGVGSPADRLDISRPETIARLRAQMKETGLPVRSLMMGLLNDSPLATDPRAPAWLDQAIAAARELGAPVILLAFFGAGDLLDAKDALKEAEFDEAIKRIRRAAPRAAEAGVTLAIENYLNGEQNARMLERINHEAASIYYDVFNTGTTKGHDVPADVKRLGHRISQYHFKNGPKYLDEEPAKFEPIAAAVRNSGFKGWAVLETSAPSKDAVADARRNGAYLRKLLNPI